MLFVGLAATLALQGPPALKVRAALQGPPALKVCARTHAGAPVVTRREAFSAAALGAAAFAAAVPSAAHASRASAGKVLSVPELAVKAKALRLYAATCEKMQVPAEARANRFAKKKAAVLLPLLAGMTEAAPGLGLGEADQKRAELLPQLLKGHYLEVRAHARAAAGAPAACSPLVAPAACSPLSRSTAAQLDEALSKGQFSPYVSSSTGKTYEGGRVERELEEVEETAEEFVALMAKAGK